MSNTISERLKGEREAKKWSQAELARQAKVSAGNVGNIEAGTREGNAESVVKIAMALGVRAEWLVLGKGPKAYGAGEALEAAAPPLQLVLSELGTALAANMPDETRDELADNLAQLARRRGAERYQELILKLLQPMPTPAPEPEDPAPAPANQQNVGVTDKYGAPIRYFQPPLLPGAAKEPDPAPAPARSGRARSRS